jgi:hypothetical protein
VSDPLSLAVPKAVAAIAIVISNPFIPVELKRHLAP